MEIDEDSKELPSVPTKDNRYLRCHAELVEA